MAAQQTPALKVPVLTRCLPSVGDFFVAGGICLPFGSRQCAKVGGRLQAAFCERHFRHHGGRHEHPESGGPRTTGGSVTGGRTHDRSYQIGVGGAAQPLGAAHRRQATAMATDARDCVLARCCSRLSVCNTCQHTAANPVRGARHRRWDRPRSLCMAAGRPASLAKCSMHASKSDAQEEQFPPTTAGPPAVCPRTCRRPPAAL